MPKNFLDRLATRGAHAAALATLSALCALALGACATSTATPPAAAPTTAAAGSAPPVSSADTTLCAGTSAEVPALLKTLEQLVAIESGSRDLEGLGRIADEVAGRLRRAGMQVETKPTKAPDFHPQLKGATLGPMVYATRTGTGQRKVLLIAHMDTVYTRGMVAKQPFRIDGDRAYGLGIADDKQGVALILHTVEMLARRGFNDYAQLGVLINGDEEIGSPGSAAFITQVGGEYDAVFSFEGGGNAAANGGDMVRLATSSIAIVEMKVTGKASHAGAAPHLGRNALYELSHQILKSRNFGDPAKGLQINWTVANSGASRNVIPAEATAIADVRSLTNQDLDLMEAALKKSIEDKLIPDTQAAGQWRGGSAVSIELENTGVEATMTVRGLNRFHFRPWGADGGEPGRLAEVVVNPGTPKEKSIGKIAVHQMKKGDVVRITSSAGGGLGEPVG